MIDRRTKLCVVVADDDANLREILCLFLRNARYEAIGVENGRVALVEVKKRRPDLVLLDVVMPEMDGFTACKHIKKDPATRTIPVIMCTGQNRQEDVRAALQAGADDYIFKPFDKKTVLTKVDRMFVVEPASLRASQVQRRGNRRRVAGWFLSWGKKGEDGLAPIFKTRVIDISLGGFSFEFVRCDVCTGYERGTVHPLCLLARHGSPFKESETIDFILSIENEVVLEIQGKVAHVYQWPENPGTEKVGVVFTKITPEAQHVIRERLEGKRTI